EYRVVTRVCSRAKPGGSVVFDAMGCRGYRAFSQPPRVSWRPITVIFGKNNSGKTTLARLPLFAMASALDPNMYSLGIADLRFGASFANLASVDQPHPRISVELSWGSDRHIDFELQRVVTPDGVESVHPKSLPLDSAEPISRTLSPPAPNPRDAINEVADPRAVETFARRRAELADLLARTIHIPSARPPLDSSYVVR